MAIKLKDAVAPVAECASEATSYRPTVQNGGERKRDLRLKETIPSRRRVRRYCSSLPILKSAPLTAVSFLNEPLDALLIRDIKPVYPELNLQLLFIISST